ncbi:MAG TPA: hypothetical protein PLS03_08405 [Terrimicrobiaceae bacterium]|nr:hypothetical protein [Terrimicrobiaceae bacterium]
MKKSLLIVVAVIVASFPAAHAQWTVAAPGVEARQDQKNIFDVLKYTWEQAKWAEKLATLHNTLTTVQQQLETANQVKQAIGDPVAAVALIDNGLFSGYLEESGIADTLGELADIAREGGEISATIGQLFEPIRMDSWKNLALDTTRSFEGVASFRDGSNPLKRFRAVENAYSRFETMLGRAHNKRKVLNRQISKLNAQLKGAKDDAEVQKLVGSLAAAQTALDDIDYLTESTASQVQMMHILNQNRTQEEEVAAEEISRELNRELARMSAEAEAEIDLPDLTAPNDDLPPGF